MLFTNTDLHGHQKILRKEGQLVMMEIMGPS